MVARALPDASLAVSEGAVTGGDDAVELAYDPAGLSDAQLAKFPQLEGFIALRPVGSTARRCSSCSPSSSRSPSARATA